MSRCSDHKTALPDTHRHFRLAIEISREFPIVCGGSRAQKEQLKKTNMLGLAAFIFEFFDFLKINFQTCPCAYE